MLKYRQSCQNDVVHGFERDLVNSGESGVELVLAKVIDGAELALLFHAESSHWKPP